MPQVIHIFRKDLRRYWPFALALALLTAVEAALYGLPPLDFAGPSTPIDRTRVILESALGLGWLLLAVFVVHEDAVPGSSQDWLIRPIGWRKMLAAKALFVLAVIIVPNALADACSVALQGFNPLEYLPGLVTRRALSAAFLLLPVLMAAALTSRLAQVAGAVLAFFVLQALMGAIEVSASAYLGGFEWLRPTGLYAAAAALSLIVIFQQYANRRTMRNVSLATAGCLLVVLIPQRFPAAAAHWVERLLAPSISTGIRVSLEADRAGGPAGAAPSSMYREFALVYLPLRINGVPAGQSLRVHRAAIELNGAGGMKWREASTGPEYFRYDPAGSWLGLRIPRKQYDTFAARPAGLTVRLSMALFAPTVQAEVRVGAAPVAVRGLGRCLAALDEGYSNGMLNAWCSQPFMHPRDLSAAVLTPGSDTPSAVLEAPLNDLLNPLRADLFGLDPIGTTRLLFAPAGTASGLVRPLPPGVDPRQASVVFTSFTAVSLAEATLAVPAVVLRDYFR
jgi:hypothetical protein